MLSSKFRWHVKTVHVFIFLLALVCVFSANSYAISAKLVSSRSGVPSRWKQHTIELELVEPDESSPITKDAIRDAIESGVAEWNNATRRCRG
jgi:hypothetical protein